HPPATAVYAEVGRRYGSRLSPVEIAPRFVSAFQREEIFDRRHGLQTSEEREILRWRHIVGEVLDDVADAEQCFQTLFDHFGSATSWRCDAEAAATISALAERGYEL